MATGIGCDLCNEEMAVALQTNLQDGEVLGIGPSCLLTFYLSSARELAKQVESEQGQAVAPIVLELAQLPVFDLHLEDGYPADVQLAISQAADAAAAPDRPARKPRGGRGKAAQTAQAEDGAAPDGAQAAASVPQGDGDGEPIPF